jgi:hypothetical protein
LPKFHVSLSLVLRLFALCNLCREWINWQENSKTVGGDQELQCPQKSLHIEFHALDVIQNFHAQEVYYMLIKYNIILVQNAHFSEYGLVLGGTNIGVQVWFFQWDRYWRGQILIHLVYTSFGQGWVGWFLETFLKRWRAVINMILYFNRRHWHRWRSSIAPDNCSTWPWVDLDLADWLVAVDRAHTTAYCGSHGLEPMSAMAF